MKKIGFIDFYISEWHSNHYPEWIKNACAKKNIDFKIAYAWAEKDISDLNGRSTEEWCREYGAEKCETLEEICKKSDFLMILAPSNPEVHLKYAETVLKYGKPTYIDKTFAEDYKSACKIFEIAEKYKTKFFSSSALRYADELKTDIKPIYIETTGGGSSLEEYIVHQCEIAVKMLKAKPTSVIAESINGNIVLNASFDGGKSAKMSYHENNGFSVYMRDESGEEYGRTEINSPFFDNLIADIVNFFDTGELTFDTNETKDVIKLAEMSIKAKNNMKKNITI